MGKFEQGATQADVSQVGAETHVFSHMEHARSIDSSFKFTADDTAQKTIENKFGTPEIAGLDGDSKTGDSKFVTQKNAGGGDEQGAANMSQENGKSAEQKAGDGKASQQDMSIGGGEYQKFADGKNSDKQQEMTSNGQAKELDDSTKNGKDGLNNKENTLNADDLQHAGEQGRLTEMLTKAGVDVNNPKELNEYLARAFDNHIIQGLTLAGEKLPANPTDADLGKALLPAVARSSEVRLKQALETNPALGYASIREHFVAMQNQALANEK